MTALLPICVVGGGAIGKRHIEVANASDRTRLTAIVEPQQSRRDELIRNGLPAVTDISEIPAETRAAIIATPTPAHYGAAIQCLERGWAVLVEKPITGTIDEAKRLISTAENLGLPLFTGHHRRCHPFSMGARRALEQIGEPVGVQGLWSLRKHDSYYDTPWRRLPGAGPLMTNLSHEIDLLSFFFGNVTEVSALKSSARRGFEIEDTAAISLRFDNGALGSFLISDAGASPWSFEAASSENPAIAGSGEDYLKFVGTEGALSFPSLCRWGRSGEGEIEWSKPLLRHDGQKFPVIDPLLEQVDRFARVVTEGASDDVLCTGANGLAALEMTLAVAMSAKVGAPVRSGTVPGDYRGD